MTQHRVHPTSPMQIEEDRRFRALRQFNSDEGRRLAGRRDRMAPIWMDWFKGNGLPNRLGRALSKRHAIDMKEFCESFEFLSVCARMYVVPLSWTFVVGMD